MKFKKKNLVTDVYYLQDPDKALLNSAYKIIRQKYQFESFGSVDSGTATGLTRSPVWSGYCDVDGSANADTLSTPGSRLSGLVWKVVAPTSPLQ